MRVYELVVCAHICVYTNHNHVTPVQPLRVCSVMCVYQRSGTWTMRPRSDIFSRSARGLAHRQWHFKGMASRSPLEGYGRLLVAGGVARRPSRLHVIVHRPQMFQTQQHRQHVRCIRANVENGLYTRICARIRQVCIHAHMCVYKLGG